MMGFCGLNCVECRCYKGTLTSDIPLLEQAAKEWSDKVHTYQAKDMMCLGCAVEDSRLVFRFCKECPVRLCALAKKVPTCAACPEFDACDKFKDLTKYLANPTAAEKMRLLRTKVLAS
jgi:hypothetical protein